MEAYLQQIKKSFVFYVAVLMLVVGGTSLYLGKTHALPVPGIRPLGPIIYSSKLEKDYKNLSQKYSLASRATTTNTAAAVPVLVYHGVVEEDNGEDVSKDLFFDQMQTLYNDGWQTISAADFVSFIQGEKQLPDKSFLLTFDDGRRDSFYSVDPILRLFGYKAVDFIISGFSFNDKTTYYVNRKELAYMRDSGRWDLQAHAQEGHDPKTVDDHGTEGDFLSNKIWLADQNRLENDEEYTARVARELSGIKEDLNRELGINAQVFAFPFSDYGQDTKNMQTAQNIVLAEAAKNYAVGFVQIGFGIPFSQNYAKNNKDFYLAKRITIDRNLDAQQLFKIMDAGKTKVLPFTEEFKNPDNWINTWGKSSIENGSMSLSATDVSTGASVYLDGGKLLSNYLFTAETDFIKGQSYNLNADYQDEQNYVSCNYSSFGVAIRERVDGKETQHVQKKINNFDVHQHLKVGIAVSGNSVSCLLDGKVVVSKTHEAVNFGSVGFKVWDPQPNNAVLKVQTVTIVSS